MSNPLPSTINKNDLPHSIVEALENYNKDNKTDWNWNTPWNNGQNWSNEGTQFDTFINNYLFPKIAATTLAQQNLGNRFDFLAKEVPDMTAVMREDYVIADSVPTGLNLSKPEENMLKVNYPKMIAKLYSGNSFLKEKFTLNNNDAILNFQKIGDAISYAIAVYKKRVSDINMYEETTIKAMLIDYGLNQVKDQRSATSRMELAEKISEALLNLQNNSWRHNEASTATGGKLARYSTYTPLKDTFILTTDSTKAFLLNSVVANTYQIAGIDYTDKVISFEDLGGTYRLTDDVTLQDGSTVAYLKSMGAYEAEVGDVLYKGTTLVYNPNETLGSTNEFSGKLTEIRPSGDLFAEILDVNSIGYKRKTAGMLSKPFFNGERNEYTYWLHYQSQKYMRPFFNKIVISGASGSTMDTHITE